MPATLQPIRAIKCTYEDCSLSFDTEELMKKHKRYTGEHDYCHKCDEDFKDYDDYVQHKILRPKEHGKACRVCGDEFKSTSGLRCHIELAHRVDQTLVCVGCHKEYYRASLFIEHLEFGHCEVVTPDQFYGHIVHKHLITDLLRNNEAFERFKQKQIKYDAAQDQDKEGGVSLSEDAFADVGITNVDFKALAPQDVPGTHPSEAAAGAYPPLPSHTRMNSAAESSMTKSMNSLSLATNPKTASAICSRAASTIGDSVTESNTETNNGSTTKNLSTAITKRQPKVWANRDGKTPASQALFPDAKPTPTAKNFSIASYDQQVEEEHGVNMFNTRFWDPNSIDWNPERFHNAITRSYSCPFICEQIFKNIAELNNHVRNEHRIVRMKCPMCQRSFRSTTALIAHCEIRAARCEIARANGFNMFLDRISGGFLSVKEQVRPDHAHNPAVLVSDRRTGRMEKYEPPVATCLTYTVTQPPDWKEPEKKTVIGGFPTGGM